MTTVKPKARLLDSNELGYRAWEMDAFLEFQACKLENNAHTHACLLQPVALEVAEALRGKEAKQP